uniref:TMC domain-containing protein n=1 Tax=Parascaris univalens TaxID=6257 RepID=A0A915BGP7_PARUN
QNQSDVSASSSHQIQLQERTSSKITLDEELFDILYAFGESEAFLGADASGAGAGVNGPGDDEEEGKPMTRQVLLDKIRQKKEVIGKLRCQPWSMNRKRRTLKLAQKYLEQHEPRVSKTHLYKEELKKRWRATCRWVDNIRIYLIPWEAKIKRIESHFGSVVSSYFTFLRWVVYINLIITMIVISFIVIPEVLADAAADEGRKNRTESRKVIPSKERIHADELQVVLHFDGYIKYSPLFYGYYANDEFVGASVREEFVGASVRYAVPLAYFIITLFIFGYSFFVILRKMAANARMSKLASGKTDQYIFNWKVFTGWDYTIGNPDTASNTVMAIMIKLRESIAECRIQAEKKFQVLLFLSRVFANAVILGMLAFSIYCISFAVQSSETVEKTGSLFTKNQVPTIVATITHVFPMIFDLIGKLERYHPRTALRAHLTRVLVLYVVNYLTLIIALFEKLDKIRGDEIMKILDGRQSLLRLRRQAREHIEILPLATPFVSRNFTSPAQAQDFLNKSITRFTEEQQPPGTTAVFNNATERTKRKTETSTATTKTITTKKNSPQRLTIEPQFGPVGLNNPNALLFNDTFPPGRRRFQTIKLGPTKLRVFTPPPTPPRPTLDTNVNTELGPDWRNLGRRPKTTHSPKIMASTTPTATVTHMPKATVAWTPRMTITHEPRTQSTRQSNRTTKVQSTTTKSSTPTTTTSKKADVTLMSSTMPTTMRIKLLPFTQISSTLQAKSTRQTPIEFMKTAATTALEKITSTASTVILRNKVTTTKPPTAAVTSSPPTSRETTPTTTLSSTNETFPRQAKTTMRPTLSTSTIADSDGANSSEKIIQDQFNKRKMIHQGRNRNVTVEPTTKNESRLKMIVLSPDEEPVEIPKNVTLVNLDNHDNDTYYEIGDSARITTEEAEMENHFCWETMIGQEIVKLVTMDLIITIASIFVIDFFRGLWIKYCSAWWCWDIETTFPEYGEFKVAENVLHIIYNQGLIWLGLFFAPLLPAINNIKLIVLMYIRGWACMTCNVPAREIFRASRSSNFYLLILLLWLLLCTLPVGYVIASKRPSSTCGPFAGHERFYNVVTKMLEGRMDAKVIGWLRYVASPGVVIPLLLLLMLIIYFLVSLVRGLREANNDLQQQLIHERTEEKKKIFELAGGGNKKKPTALDRTEKKKKIVTYLPLVEQKRREPWRAYNGLEHDSSVCVTDETVTVTTPSSNAPSPPLFLRAKQEVDLSEMLQERALPHVHHHSISSVEEEDHEMSVGPSGGLEGGTRRMTSAQSVAVAKSNVTDRADDWFNNEDVHDEQQYEVESNAVELATFDEIRDLIHPLTTSLNASSVSLAAFPKDADLSPVTVVFPTPTLASAGSRRSSKRFSYISIYESPHDESQLTRSIRSVATLLRNESTGMLRLHESAINGTSKQRRSSAYQQPSMHRSLDPIIAADREKEIEEECANAEDNESQSSSKPTEVPSQRSVSSAKKFEPKVTATEFLPWPSIDEMRERRSKLQPLLPQTSSTSSRPSRRTSPPKRIRTIEGSPTKDETPAASSKQRKFRISVSPTRRLQTDLSGSDTDTSTGKRRFLIKQEILPGSMASVATTDTTRTAATNNKSGTSSSRAPRVQFGDDDSPLIEAGTDMEPKGSCSPLEK